jgi:hypothetical protein
MKCFAYSFKNCTDRFSSTNREYTLLTSGTSTTVAFRRRATRLDVEMSWMAYLKDVSEPILVRISSAASDSVTSSSSHLKPRQQRQETKEWGLTEVINTYRILTISLMSSFP